jgi:aminopeptidase N
MIKNLTKAPLWAAVCSLSLLYGCCDHSKSAKSNAELLPAIERVQSESLSDEYAAIRAKQVSNVSYKLSVILDETSTGFEGVSEIRFDLIDNNNNDLTIDFDQGSVESITRDGTPVNFSYTKWFITIPKEELSAGKNSLVVTYKRPYATDGSGLHRFVDPENSEIYLYSDFEPYDANRLFPHFDQPSLKATYTLDVKAPKHWKVISSTRETEIEELDDANHWIFPTSKKFSSYIFSLHAGNYDVLEDKFEDIPLRLFVRTSLAEYVKTDDWFTPTKQSFKFFNDYFEVRYPFEKYDQIIAPDFNAGAMENVAAVTFSETFVSRGEKSTEQKMRLANVIAHEMAHMWFGDLVTMRWWNGLWLNESFATYMANLAIDKASDFDNVWDVFYSGTKQWAYSSDDSVNTHAIELPVNTTADAMANFDGITYGKGASVLKQLPYYLGEENFRVGVSNYLKKFSYKNTELSDFMDELGKAADKDLTQWTQDWLYKAGLNSISVDYQCDGAKISSLSINQTAPEQYPTLREQRVQLGLYSFNGSTMSLTKAIPVLYKGESTQIKEAVGQACPDLVYPNEGDWGYVKVVLDEKSLASVKKHINAIESKTMRLMLWQSLSDSVDDANLPADEFANFAMANIHKETDYNVAKKIVDSLMNAVGYLNTATRLDQKDFIQTQKEAEYLLWHLVKSAEPKSDLQKLWYTEYSYLAQTPDHLANLEKVLNGEIKVDGITIDQDKRWRLIARLNRFEFGDYKTLLTAEKVIDNSDKGTKYGIYSEVLRPEASVKAKWFKELVENPNNLKLSTLRFIMYGMFPPEQSDLENAYKARIVDHIATLNNSGDLGLLSNFTSQMLPVACTSESEQSLSRLVESYIDMKPQAVKAIKSAHEKAERCVKVLNLL